MGGRGGMGVVWVCNAKSLGWDVSPLRFEWGLVFTYWVLGWFAISYQITNLGGAPARVIHTPQGSYPPLRHVSIRAITCIDVRLE